jgi:hypothetical protein
MGSVDVPDELIRAHAEGRLVLFVGAGASVDPPSSLPSFVELAKRIAVEVGQTPTEQELTQADALLGRLDGSAEVHHRVRSMLSPPNSQPNQLHEAIVGLAHASGSFRVVTTNYDRHLSDAAAARGLDVAEYLAPALPLGDDFEGLVYLHGSLPQKARRLVVTDRDFGRAYLTEGWATTFLQRMFHSYTALFIGYSHGDVVMRYLARGLGPNARRFALDRSTSETNWEALGIIPVWFDVVGGSWAQLTETVQRWGQRASMNLLEHHQRIASLVQLPPNNIPEDMSYLESMLEQPDTAREFTQLATRNEWLEWANARPQFDKLFGPKAASDEVTRTLAYWYAESFVVASETANDIAFKILADRGGVLSPTCVGAIGHLLHIDQTSRTPRPSWLDRWLPYLLQAESWDQSWWEYALLASTWADNKAAVLLLFDYLTEPFLAFDRYGFEGHGRPGRIGLRASRHHLEEIWENVFKPHLDEAADSVLAITERHLRRARQLHELSAPTSLEWDPVSLHRDSVSTTPSRLVDPIDILIDTARDSLLQLVDSDWNAGLRRCDDWAASGVPMLERLAAHAIGHAIKVDANDKLAWLLERPEWLFKLHVRPEVLELIEAAAESSPAECLDALVSSVMTPPASSATDDDETLAHGQARWQLPLLGAIRRIRSDHAATSAAVDELESKHPDLLGLATRAFEPRFTGGAISDKPPMSSADLRTALDEDPALAIDLLYSYRDAHTPWNGPNWNGVLQLVAETVAESPQNGFTLLHIDREQGDLTGAVINGWSRATLDDRTAAEVIDRLGQLDHAFFGDDLARLLSDGGRYDHSPTNWARLPGGRRLAVSVWSALPRPDDSEMPAFDDWLGTAINRSAGRLAEFWLHVISEQWKAQGDEWQGIPSDVRAALDAMIDAGDEHGRLAEVVLASKLHFLHAADTSWCEQHLLRHLRWDDPDRAVRNWQGFLISGQPRDRLLIAGLLKDYLDTAANADRFTDEQRRRLAEHLGVIAVYSEVEPTSWLAEFTRRTTIDLRVQWIEQVAWCLRQLNADAVDAQWTRWMRTYWLGRLDNTPIAFSDDEASALVGWTTNLANSYEEAVEIATRHAVYLAKADQFVRELGTQHKSAEPTGRLLLHVLTGSSPPFWDCGRLEAMVADIKPCLAPDVMERIKNEAVRLGCHTAHSW